MTLPTGADGPTISDLAKPPLTRLPGYDFPAPRHPAYLRQERTEDIESLHAAGILRQMERTAHLYIALPKTGPLTTRLRMLVKNRVDVFEGIAPVRRFADRMAATSASIADGLELHHLVLRTQVAEVFERELKEKPRHRRATALDAIDVAASWENWELLRQGKGLSVTSAARVMEVLIAGAVRG